MSDAQQTTLAAVWHGGGRLAVEPWELPPPGPGEVLVEVAGCGLCGSDLHVLDDGFPGLQPPVVLGHEPAGMVAALGPGVDGFALGDAVTWEPKVTCGRCFYCREGGEGNLCENQTRISGSFAKRTVVPLRALHRLPPGTDPKTAIMAEPLSCALYAFDRAAVGLGENVAIVGGGTIGLLLVLLVRRAGAATVVVSDPNPRKRELALELGADAAVDPSAAGLREAVTTTPAGRGFDAVLEAVGKPRAVEDALAAARPGGRVVLVGASQPGDRAALDLVELQRRDLTLHACWVRKHTFQRAVALLPQLPLGRLVTHEVELEDVREAVRLLREGEAVKVMVAP